jgi:predicted nucleic acid-binding protein
MYISPYVIEESELGDSEAAQRRMVILETIPSLDITPQIEQLAERIAKALKIPRLAQMDAFHLACAIEYGLDYLLTWNCTHLANGPRLKMLSSFAATESLWMPIILTPMEMVSEKGE